MIIFKKLDITSFKSIFDISVDFTKLNGRFFSLEGKNNLTPFAESNGTGKSTVFDALAYVMYGTTMGTFIKKEDYQNKYTVKPLKLVLDFEITNTENKGTYTIVRTLKTLQLSKNGEDISELTKTETENKLQSILNLSKDEFFSFTYITQTTGGNFLNKTASEKLAIIKDFVFGEELSQISDKLNQLVKAIKTKKSDLEVNLARLEGSLNSFQDVNIIQEVNFTEQDIADAKAILEKLKKQRKEKVEQDIKNADLRAKFKRLQQDMAKIKTQLVQAKSNICPLCQQELHDDSVKQQLISSALKIKEDAKVIKQQLLDISENVLDIPENIDNKINELVSDISEKESILRNNSQHDQISKRIKELTEQKDKTIIDLTETENKYNQIVKLQKYFNNSFVQFVQKAFLLEIENYLNLYCFDVFNENFSLKFDKNSLNLFIGDHPYAYFSGGERQRIDFLFVFAIKVALSSFTDKCTNLIIFDESLSAQDGTSFDNCIELIDKLSMASNLTTILVSHRNNNLQNKILLERCEKSTSLDIVSSANN